MNKTETKKTTTKRLTLTRQNLRTLTSDELRLVAVAAHPEHTTDRDYTAADGARDAKEHGARDGRLPATRSNLALISKLTPKNVEPEKIADVGVFNGLAYLAAWGVVTCKYDGVHVVDVNNVSGEGSRC